MKMSVFQFDEAKLKARELAEAKLAKGENADEFVQIAEVNGFKLYVCAGKTIKTPGKERFHSNPRDCFHLLLASPPINLLGAALRKRFANYSISGVLAITYLARSSNLTLFLK